MNKHGPAGYSLEVTGQTLKHTPQRSAYGQTRTFGQSQRFSPAVAVCSKAQGQVYRDSSFRRLGAAARSTESFSARATPSSLGTGRFIAHTGGGNWTSVAVLLQPRWSARTIPAWSVDTVSTRPDGGKGRLVRRTNQSKTRDPSATARRASQSCPSLTRGAAADRHCSAPAVTVGQLARSRPGPPAQSRLDWMGMEGRRIRSTNQV